jgi:hypothetical protein
MIKIILWLGFTFVVAETNSQYCYTLSQNYELQLCGDDNCCKIDGFECVSSGQCSQYADFSCLSQSDCKSRCCETKTFGDSQGVWIVIFELIFI